MLVIGFLGLGFMGYRGKSLAGVPTSLDRRLVGGGRATCRAFFRCISRLLSGVRPFCDNATSSFSTPAATILIASSGKGRLSALLLMLSVPPATM